MKLSPGIACWVKEIVIRIKLIIFKIEILTILFIEVFLLHQFKSNSVEDHNFYSKFKWWPTYLEQ